MKLFAAALVAITLALTSASAHHDSTAADLYKWGDQHVWSVKHFYNDGSKGTGGYQSHGSGVWLNDTTMVTACHVTTGETQVYATLNGHDEVAVDFAVEFCNKRTDQSVMSVIEGEQRDIAPVVFGAMPRRGERVFIIGYPHDNPLTVTTGWFVGKSVMGITDNEMWMLAANAAPGNSGGAVVVLRDGEIQLIGILTSGYAGGNITQMRSLEVTKAWLALAH